MHITMWKKPIWKGYSLYDFNCMIFQKRQNYGDSKKIGGCQGFGGREGWIGQAQRIFRALKVICMVLQRWILVIHLLEPAECATPSVNPNVNCWLWVIMIHQHKFMDCKKCSTVVWGCPQRGKLCLCGDSGLYGNCLYFLLNFAINLKL